MIEFPMEVGILGWAAILLIFFLALKYAFSED